MAAVFPLREQEGLGHWRNLGRVLCPHHHPRGLLLVDTLPSCAACSLLNLAYFIVNFCVLFLSALYPEQHGACTTKINYSS